MTTPQAKRTEGAYATVYPKDQPAIVGRYYYGVTTPDGGVLNCCSPADAGRVCDLLNELTDSNADLVDACKKALADITDVIERQNGADPALNIFASEETRAQLRSALSKAQHKGGGETENAEPVCDGEEFLIDTATMKPTDQKVKTVRVRCDCGWKGHVGELLGVDDDATMWCPLCETSDWQYA